MMEEVQTPGEEENTGAENKGPQDGFTEKENGTDGNGNDGNDSNDGTDNNDANETPAEEKPQDKAAEESERYLRLSADFENFRKRTARERIELITMAEKDTILSMLPVLDDFERAAKALENATEEAKKELGGFQLIYTKMLQNLESRGLKAMDAKGKTFDVEYHEAITKVPAPDAKQKNTVLEEVEKGYLLNGTVIRFAKVVIAE